MTGQERDLFGELIVPESEQPAYMAAPVRVEQPRLFEPQMEGQLELGETGD